MDLWGFVLFNPNIENKATTVPDLVEETIGKDTEFPVFSNILGRVKDCPLFLPSRGVSFRSFNLKIEKFTLTLIEPSAERTDLG